MTRYSYMQISDQVEVFLFPDYSPESFLINLIEKYGSVELGIGISSQSTSEKMIEALQSVTNGFLVFNAIYLDRQTVRLPEGSEKDSLEKSWKMPLRWLYPPVAADLGKESGSLANTLGPLLRTHKIKALLMSDEHAFILHRMKSDVCVLPDEFLRKMTVPSFAEI